MRYAPQFKFPKYSYVPGKFPHPLSHPHGHRFASTGIQYIDVQTEMDKSVTSNLIFRYAIDLYNAGYFWEAHEQWEKLWHATGRKNLEAIFYKGLIKLAAAGVKEKEGIQAGVLKHSLRAKEIFLMVIQSQSEHPRLHKLNLHPLLDSSVKIQQACSLSSLDNHPSDKSPSSVKILLEQLMEKV